MLNLVIHTTSASVQHVVVREPVFVSNFATFQVLLREFEVLLSDAP